MSIPVNNLRGLAVSFIGLVSGVVFTYIVGVLDSADYLVEQWTIWIIEVPFMVMWAVCERKYGWKTCLLYAGVGTAVSFLVSYPESTVSPLVYLKVSVTGVILGETGLFGKSFARRLVAVSSPGFVLAAAFGLPMIFRGVAPEVLDRFREDALEMYKAFMTNDEAINAADNAVQVFRGIFKTGFAVLAMGSVMNAWISFHGARIVMGKFRERPEEIPPFQSFKLPFHAVWAFLAAFGLLLGEIEPVYPLALNVLVFMVFLYLIQGLAVVTFQMNRLSLGRFPRVVFWLFFFFTIAFTGIILVFIGLLDNWFNFRPDSPDVDLNENQGVS